MKNILSSRETINIRGKLMNFRSPKVMAILNVTPDSFLGSSRISSVEHAIEMAGKFLDEGADILDVGAYSSRPGATDISPGEELERLIPVIKALSEHFPEAVISADTFRAGVAEQAVMAGAGMVNDISGGSLDPQMFETIARLKVPYVLMHMKGTPQTMNKLTEYEEIMPELLRYFSAKIFELNRAGVHDIIADPGFGFAKTREQSFTVLRQLGDLRMLGLPILAGISRKSLIYKTLGTDADGSLNGTTVLNTIALMNGAKILRVHDVKEARECVVLVEGLLEIDNINGTASC